MLIGDAAACAADGAGWTVETSEGRVEAREAVVALGPWSRTCWRRSATACRSAVKRGYHMHYAAAAMPTLNRPVLDAEHGYVLAPMERGIRLTTGAEFAARDAPPTPVQLDARARRWRGELFPLGERAGRRALDGRAALHARHAAR